MPVELRGLAPLLQVWDMPASVRFWTETMGFEIVETAGPEGDMGWAWLRRGGSDIMLNTMYELAHRPLLKDADREAAHRDTCLYIGCPDVDGMYEELLSRGLKLKPPKVAPYGMKQLYVTDPDGYNICFQWTAAAQES